jgi:glycine/D-amino acid oxidase-like deaminating enzyme
VAAGIKAQSALMRVARREAETLVANAGLAHMIRSDGVLELYQSEAELRATAKDDAAKAAEGIEFRHVRGNELAELQPGLAPSITCGTFIPKWQTVSDPYDYAVAVANAAIEGCELPQGRSRAAPSASRWCEPRDGGWQQAVGAQCRGRRRGVVEGADLAARRQHPA